jgi:hypothetical protein
MRCFYPEPIDPGLSIAEGIKAEIGRLAPQTWVIENVWAARPYLSRLFGPVAAKPFGHALWSNVALLLPNIEPHKGGRRAFAHLKKSGAHNRSFIPNMRHAPAEAAKIPYEIGEAICRAVESRTEQDATENRVEG